MRINFYHKAEGAKQYEAKIKQVIQKACIVVKCKKKAEVAIVMIGDAKMKKLNGLYRKKDKTTNVLSFSAESQSDLGDIFISVPEARRETKKYGYTIGYELQRLALHGFLHLVGYDHVKEKDTEKMEKIENKIMKI